LHQELLARAADSEMANKIHAILFKRRLPVDPRHNSKIERPHLAKWAALQLSGPRSRSQRTRPVAESSPRHCQLEQSEGDFRRFASAIHQVACDV
jgi:olefin beta-lactone synthetase